MPEWLWQLRDVRVGPVAQPRIVIEALTITRGVTVILGPSGSGKSTLLNLLVGFIRPEVGALTAAPAPSGRLPVFWACAGAGLWPGVSATRHLSLVAPIGTAPHADLLTAFGLAAVSERAAEALSSGERDRLDVARAVASDAAVLVLDEPFSRCQPQQSMSLWQLVRQHARARDQSLVYATHDPALAVGADAVIELQDGRMVGARRALAALALMLVLPGCGAQPTFPVSQATMITLPPDAAVQPSPRGLCPLRDGGMIVLDTVGRLVECAADGSVRRSWRMPAWTDGRPEGACELPSGDIAVADTHYHRVVVFRRDGSERMRWGGEGDAPGQFRWPVSICCDPRGRIWVGEYGGNDRIQRFTADGTPDGSFGRFGSGIGELQRPQGLAWRDGHIYISDALNRRVQVWTDAGVHVRDLAVGVCELPYGMSAGPGDHLTIADYGRALVARVAPDGTITTWGEPGRGERQLATPWAAAVATNGSTWVCDTGNRRLWILAP